MTVVRTARPADVEAMLAIYTPMVEQTAVSFELEPPSPDEFGERLAATAANDDPWLVSEIDGVVAGFAYASRFRSRPAYGATRETTVYVDDAHRGRGVGRSLMTTLLTELESKGIHRAIAGIVLPNEGSIALHEALGYRLVGVFTEVGHKLGRWHDLGFWERSFSRPPSE